MSEEGNAPVKRSKRAHSPHNFDDEEHVEPPAFSLATLGLQRVGTAPPPKKQPQQPIQALNARGMPARIRKRNRLFYDDDIINDDKPLRMSLSPRKGIKDKLQPPIKSPIKTLKKKKILDFRYQDDRKKATTTSSPVKSPTVTVLPPSKPNSKSALQTTGTQSGNKVHLIPTDKKIGHRIGLRLRNLLKLPKAHKWVIYEWFYSFIDKPLFDGSNDFQDCLVESFPHLKTRNLTRGDWQKLRSMMGKPRRCSQAFFDEERRELERKRQKIRYMQTRKSGEIRDYNFVRDLPAKIPLTLPIGTKVTARLRIPQDGIFSGTVDAFDSLNSTYRIAFDRVGLGTHPIPDYEIVSENFHEMLPIQSITKDFRPNLISIYQGLSSQPSTSTSSTVKGIVGVRSALSMNLNKSDPLLGQEILESPFKNTFVKRERVNGYPVKLLETLVRLKRALSIKRAKLERVNAMNTEAELKLSQRKNMILSTPKESESSESKAESGNDDESKNVENLCEVVSCEMPTLSEFQRRYASIVISLEKMNRDMQTYLNDVQEYCTDLTRDPQVQAMLAPSYLREKCREAAEDAVQRNNQGIVKNKNILCLIKNLATVLLVASHLNNDGNSAQVSKILEGCIEEVRTSLYSGNVETFQKHVQIHLHHIRLGIGHRILASQNATSRPATPDN